MGDVFISYKREDETAVARLVKALRGEGLSVWWDRDIPVGAAWEETIEREHEAARVVVVCWSKAAAASENVKAEARRARAQGRFVQTFLEPCDPPMFFGERQGVDLSGWTGRADDPRFRAVAAAVRAVLDGRETSDGVGAAAPAARSRRGRGLVMAAAALVTIGAGAFAYRASIERVDATAKPSAPARAPDPAAALLARMAGSWGTGNDCDTIYTYRSARDAATGETRITAARRGFRSEGRVVSVANGVILSEALEPASDRGNLVEIRPEAQQLVLQDRRTDVRQVLVRCP